MNATGQPIKSPQPTGISSTISSQSHSNRPAAGLDVVQKMKINRKRFPWPIWLLLLIVAVSALAPLPTGNNTQLYDKFYLVGLLLVISRYLWSWRRGGTLIDLVIYLLMVLFMRYIAVLFVELLSMAIDGYSN